MKKLISILLSISMFSSVSLADCDFSTGVTKLPDGNYEYTKACHVKVGQDIIDSQTKDKQLALLNQAIKDKDEAYGYANQRADLWMNTSFKVEDRLNTIESMQKTNNWMYFGLGVLSVFAAGYAANQIYKH